MRSSIWNGLKIHVEYDMTNKTENKTKYHREYMRAYRKKHPGYIKKLRKEHYEKYKYTVRDMLKHDARRRMNNLKRRKDWVTENCAICNNNNNIQFHHENYDEPYVIMWLCFNCHKEIHNQNRGQNHE